MSVVGRHSEECTEFTRCYNDAYLNDTFNLPVVLQLPTCLIGPNKQTKVSLNSSV